MIYNKQQVYKYNIGWNYRMNTRINATYQCWRCAVRLEVVRHKNGDTDGDGAVPDALRRHFGQHRINLVGVDA